MVHFNAELYATDAAIFIAITIANLKALANYDCNQDILVSYRSL